MSRILWGPKIHNISSTGPYLKPEINPRPFTLVFKPIRRHYPIYGWIFTAAVSFRFPHQTSVRISLLPYICHMLHHINVLSQHLFILVSSACFSFALWLSVLGPYVILSALFPYNLYVCSSLNMWDRVSHPHKKDKSIFLHVLMIIFIDSEREKRRFLHRMNVIIIYFIWKWT
jgi:hypothetical protein